MTRETLTASLLTKRLLSQSSQTYHFEFAVDAAFRFVPGQFISVLAERTLPPGHARAGEVRTDTRAYSLASAPEPGKIALCVNRVAQDGDAGFFSNLLCDLEPGAEIPFHGPHGNFILREITGPVLLLAEETGIAPVRSILQAMPDMEAYLIQSSAASVPALYGEEFTARSALHYVSVTSEGAHERSLAAVDALLAAHPEIREAYIVGLSAFVNAHRAQLKERGWDRKQIVFERYD